MDQIHRNATPAAKAAYCAGQQSPAYFWGLHDWIFANQGQWSSAQDAAAQFRQQAVSLGVDGGKYDTCVASADTAAKIQRDLKEGAAAGVESTPAFFVNDWFINGAVPVQNFQQAIQKAQQGVHPPPTATPLPPGVAPYDLDPQRPGFTYDGSPSLGQEKAPLVLIVFQDFKCPECAQFSKNLLPVVREKYVKAGQMRVAMKFLPASAPKAPVSALCAADQGKFWEYYDLLFTRQSEWQDGGEDTLAGYAKSVGADEAKFRQCLKDGSGQQTIDEDADLAQQLGIQAAPYSLLINTVQGKGARVPGVPSLDQFDKQVQTLLAPAGATPGPTKAP